MMIKTLRKVRQFLAHFIFLIWQQENIKNSSLWYVKISFFLLLPFEWLYRLGFFFVNGYKCWRGGRQTPFIVISVGNISVGGSGKSVVVPYVIDLLGEHQCAVMLRGYHSKAEKESHNYLLVNDTIFEQEKSELRVKNIQNIPAFLGDEAAMYGAFLSCPIVVGKNRMASIDLLASYVTCCKKTVKYLVLDDAYQNHQIAKTFEILLLDARLPFGNGHCLPVGPLREKDVSRADCIILTHADALSSDRLQKTKNMLGGLTSYNKIFAGCHIPHGIFLYNVMPVDTAILKNNHFLIASGVGSFESVVTTARDAGISVSETHQYDDHHDYTYDDICELESLVKNKNLDGIVTTAKDWVKIKPFLASIPKKSSVSWYVLRVSFSFLTSHDYDSFVRLLRYNRQ